MFFINFVCIDIKLGNYLFKYAMAQSTVCRESKANARNGKHFISESCNIGDNGPGK